jgi:signal transduction histidine kinase
MKKYIFIPVCAYLVFIALTGYNIRSGYHTQIEAKKKRLESYARNINTRINSAILQTEQMSAIVEFIIEGNGLPDDTAETPETDRHIVLLENFYKKYSDFIKGISIFDKYGNTLNINYMEQNGRFIRDNYKPRVVSVLRSEQSLVEEKNSYSYVFPVYQDSVLTGNINIKLDMTSLQQALFEPYSDKGDIWFTAILSRDNFTVFPSGTELELSDRENILQTLEENSKGFSFGEMKGAKYSKKVLSCYERLSFSGHFISIIFSCDISPLIFSSLLELTLIGLFSLIVLIIIIVILYRHVARNLTDIKNKEQRLSLIHAVLGDMSIGVITSKQNRFFYANKYAFDLLGETVSPDDYGKEMSKLSFPADFHYSEHKEFDGWTLCNIGIEGKEACIGKKQVSLEMNGERYNFDIFADITEMETNRKNAVRSEIAKSELLSRISTDLKKPLDAIEDALILLMQKYSDDTTITHIYDSAKKILEFIDNTQDFADIESGRTVLDEVPFNIVEAIKKVTDKYLPLARQRGINLQAHIASSVTRNVVGDPQRFRQVLDQLLSNAVKFTNEGEIRVSLEATPLQEDKILIKCTVEDTGTGMSKKKLKNLFSLDLLAKEKDESIGLGVIVAKKLVSIMGGTIRVTSPSPISIKPEAPGVQFFFTIQCYQDRELEKKLNFSSITSYDRINVLIIASEVHNVLYLDNYMKRKGICSNIFVLDKDSEDLLINKLIIDKNRYQIIFIETENSQSNFYIADKIFKKELSNSYLYVLIDPFTHKGNYLQAKKLGIDYYYFKQDEDLSNFDLLFKTHFPNAIEQNASGKKLRKDLKILVSEDNILSQSVARVIFEQLGYMVDFSRNALDLINQMNRNTYDVIFLDLKFPPTDGLEMANILRQKGYKLPIIAMTSTLTKENLKNIADNGINGYVPKPLNADNIRNTLLKWFV